MKDKVKCWQVFECDETECPVYQKKELRCWLIPGTQCRNEIQGKFLEKMEMCLQCEPFKVNMDVHSMEETLTLVNGQFTSFRQMVEERDRELEDVSMELALGLSEVFGALKEISSGDPEVRIPETSKLELITKLKHMVNLTARSLAEVVDLSHEFAMGLAEHFGVLDSVSKGNLAARVSGTSQVELLESLREVTNQMIESVSTEIAERKQAEEALQGRSHDLSERLKDLNCLYAISKLVMTPGVSFDNLFQQIVDLIPGSWHHADIACARIVLESQEFQTENFRETVWKQTSDITANGKKVGTLEVCYLEQRPEADEGPFLKEDRKLIDAIAERMGRIIEQKQAEAALRESEEKYRTQFEEALDAIFIADAQTGTLLDCNQAASVLVGRAKSELVGKHQGILHPPEEIAGKFSRTFKQHVKEKLGQALEAQVITKYGETRDVSIKANMLELKGRKVLQGMFRDITDQKRVEAEKKKLEAHLQRAEKMEVVGTLAGGVAHDLNNILGGLVSYPDLLLMELSEDSPLRKPILTIQESGQKAAAIVQDLLTLARRGVAVSEVANLNDIIREYLASPEHERLKSFHPRVQIETRLERDLLNTLASPVHLSKTIMNLVSNAAEALPDGGKVTISTKNQYIDRAIRSYDEVKEGDYVILSVADNGLGISSQDIQRIFEPFYTKKAMGRSGTGLGMAVVWGTVKDHKGYIEVKSTKGNGTRFDLYFPVTRKEAEKEKRATSIGEYMGRGESILVIDDVREQREIASVLLTQLGYSAHSVSSGEEAVVYMKSNSADLLVLDMIMDPGIDGLDTYKEILELHPGTKAIIASGFSETDRVREAQRLGAGQYIKKPYTLEKIGLAVKAELGK